MNCGEFSESARAVRGPATWGRSLSRSHLRGLFASNDCGTGKLSAECLDELPPRQLEATASSLALLSKIRFCQLSFSRLVAIKIIPKDRGDFKQARQQLFTLAFAVAVRAIAVTLAPCGHPARLLTLRMMRHHQRAVRYLAHDRGPRRDVHVAADLHRRD